MSIELFLGLDLAWQDSRPGRPANETGIAVVDPDGRVVDAGWTRGLDETTERIAATGDRPALLFIDAPLGVVPMQVGQPADWR
jgi:predicted RNase H-like nuclease